MLWRKVGQLKPLNSCCAEAYLREFVIDFIMELINQVLWFFFRNQQCSFRMIQIFFGVKIKYIILTVNTLQCNNMFFDVHHC